MKGSITRGLYCIISPGNFEQTFLKKCLAMLNQELSILKSVTKEYFCRGDDRRKGLISLGYPPGGNNETGGVLFLQERTRAYNLGRWTKRVC